MELVPPLELIPMFNDEEEELDEVVAVKVEMLRKDVQVRVELVTQFLAGTLDHDHVASLLKQVGSAGQGRTKTAPHVIVHGCAALFPPGNVAQVRVDANACSSFCGTEMQLCRHSMLQCCL